MAYDQKLAARVREALRRTRGVSEREMFGGLAFMVAGNMCCGVMGDDLMVRVGPDLHHDALVRPYTREMDFTGVSMKGMVYVGRDGVADDSELDLWVRLGVAYANSLPPKKVAKARKKKAPAKKKAAKKKAPAKKKAAKKKAAKKKAPAKRKARRS